VKYLRGTGSQAAFCVVGRDPRLDGDSPVTGHDMQGCRFLTECFREATGFIAEPGEIVEISIVVGSKP